MKELKNYLSQANNPFVPFGASHIAALAIGLALIFLLPPLANKYLNDKKKRQLGLFMAWTVFLSYAVWVILELSAGTFNLKLHLPFHLCRLVAITLPFTLLYRNNNLFQVTFYWGFSAMLLASITPNIEQGFPHFYFWRYQVAHPGTLVVLIYAISVMGFRPEKKGIILAFVAMQGLLLLALFVNIFFDANYFWIRQKPTAATLLSYMGPWPWYLIAGEVITLVFFLLAWWMFKFSKLNKPSEELI